MSTSLEEVQCPYCGEVIEIEVEPVSGTQTYIEDCSVCCHPIQFNIVSGEDGVEVNASRSDD